MELHRADEAKKSITDIVENYGVRELPVDKAVAPSPVDRYFWLRTSVTKDGVGGHARKFFATVERPECSTRGEYRLANLVLQGGGTLGLAHVGFITGLEKAGVRFLGLAGTSAGAILAMGMAAIRGKDLTAETHTALSTFVASIPMDEFIDGPRPVRKFLKRSLVSAPLTSPSYWVQALAALRRLRDKRGLNQGDAFEEWLETALAGLGFRTIDQLYDALDAIYHDVEGLRGAEAKNIIDGLPREIFRTEPHAGNGKDGARPGAALLKLMTMAMPAGLKLSLPEDLTLLQAEYQHASPARLVRTSMSIPGFFEPVVMRTNSVRWGRHIQNSLGPVLSDKEANSLADLADLWFLDGGMMSNLPSDSYRSLMPEVPTIVVPLVSRSKPKRIGGRRTYANLLSDAFAAFTAVRGQRDREVLAQNDDLEAEFNLVEANLAKERHWPQPRIYPTQIAPVDPGDANWLDFVMNDSEKQKLFNHGLEAALRFFKKIDQLDAKRERKSYA
ncbi:MAG: patatin-like phospholipase family protein [Pseudomonadota bacterium]